MTTVKVSSTIAAPVERVFELFTNLEQSPSHVTGIKGVEVLSPGRFGLGTRWTETREVMGRLDDAEMEITAFERNRTYTITHHKGGVRIDTMFWFEPCAEGTTVSIEFALDTGGMPPGLLTPLGWAVAGKVRDVLTQDLTDLKESLETA